VLSNLFRICRVDFMPEFGRSVVVVTGASAGVGRATAIAFARDGFNVGLIARGKDGLEGARRDVEAAGGHALVLPVDVAEAEAVSAAADQVIAQWGKIDVWVNDAMATIFSPVRDIKADEFRAARPMRAAIVPYTCPR